MTDLHEVLPHFDTTPFRHLIHSLEKNDVTVSDLISLDPIDIARRCPLPLGDLRALVVSVIRACQNDVWPTATKSKKKSSSVSRFNTAEPGQAGPFVQTLDEDIDACLGGGFKLGLLTEIVGESAVGKTQFALSLLLSVQLQPPLGLARSAIYLSTEAPLNTGRLLQMLENHPIYQTLPTDRRPSLDRVHTISTNDLEVQEHIIQYQLPLAIEKLDIGLIVMDSVAANFRAERDTRTAGGLADRAAELVRLGSSLRHLARKYRVAVVVINQVSDRFEDTRHVSDRNGIMSTTFSSPPSTYHLTQTSSNLTHDNIKLSLDHQQRFFTGWGDSSPGSAQQLKNPALGFAWANQLSARIVLKMAKEYGLHTSRLQIDGNLREQIKRKRYIGVVFAPWTPLSLDLVQYEIQAQGPVSVKGISEEHETLDEHSALLDPNLWYDGAADEEYP